MISPSFSSLPAVSTSGQRFLHLPAQWEAAKSMEVNKVLSKASDLVMVIWWDLTNSLVGIQWWWRFNGIFMVT